MHTTPWYYATELPNVPASNLVQIGIGGWQVPRESLPNMRERQHNVFTIGDIEELGIDRGVEMAVRPPNFPPPVQALRWPCSSRIKKLGLVNVCTASDAVVVQLDAAWKDADAVYLSYDVDSIEAAFVPGTGWPEPGGLLPREALKIVGMVAAEGLCGMELVEVSPPYDVSDITALMGLRLIVDVMGASPLPLPLCHPVTRQPGGG